MSKYTLIVFSKNKNSLTQFLIFFFTNFKNNSHVFLKLSRKKKLKEKISVLKSPHVNKTAQEQFKFSHFYINITFYTFDIKKELFILKKIKNRLFPDLKIIIKSFYSEKKSMVSFLKTKPYYSLKFSRLKGKYLFKKTISTLKFLDYYGNSQYK